MHNLSLAAASGMGWKVRRDRAKAKLARQKAPEVVLIRALRRAVVALEEAEQTAKRDFEALHQPVRSPIGEVCHPQIAALVTAFLSERGITNVLAPIEGESLEAMIARYAAEAQAANDEAVSALRALEIEKAEALAADAVARVEAIKRAGTDEMVATDVPDTEPATSKRSNRSRPRVTEGEDDPVLPM